MQMHTIHESIYAVIKLPRNGNSKAKKINKKIRCIEIKEWLDQKCQHSFLVLIQKWHKLCFENSICKRLSFNKSVNSSWAWQVCGIPKFQWWMVCGSNWIKVQSASETVYEAFNVFLKQLGVLSKQLA